MDDNKSVGYRKDYAGVKALKEIVTTTTMNTLGGSDGIDSILKKNERLPCNTCQTSSAPYLQDMQHYLQDVKYFADSYDQTGYEKVIGRTGIKSGNIWQVEGAAFLLRVLNEDHSLTTEIDAFEEEYNDVNQKVVDIVKVNNTLVECKSWSIGSAAFINFKNGSSGSFSQFVSYLQNGISNMNGLEYWFDKNKTSDATAIKNEFKDMMLTSDSKGNFVLTTQGGQVFDAIWANQIGFPQNFFPNLNQVDARIKFIQIINTLDVNFFNFIKVK